MRSREEIEAAAIARDTDCLGCAALWISTFTGPLDRSTQCLIPGHWHRPDILDFHRSLATAGRDDHELQLLSLEAESARGVLQDPENYWRGQLRAYQRRLSELGVPGAISELLARREADPTMGEAPIVVMTPEEFIAARRSR